MTVYFQDSEVIPMDIDSTQKWVTESLRFISATQLQMQSNITGLLSLCFRTDGAYWKDGPGRGGGGGGGGGGAFQKHLWAFKSKSS